MEVKSKMFPLVIQDNRHKLGCWVELRTPLKSTGYVTLNEWNKSKARRFLRTRKKRCLAGERETEREGRKKVPLSCF